jgi:ribosomal protein S18 acetylase RimI-like enzyme
MDWRTDRAAVMSFQKDVYETNFPGFHMTAGFLRDYEHQLKQAVRSQMERVVVLEDDRGVCGMLWLSLISTMVEPMVGYIKNIYVAPRLRGAGWGRALLDEADRWFQQHGCQKAALDATIANVRAVRTYLRAGYEPARYRMEKHYHTPDAPPGTTGDTA